MLLGAMEESEHNVGEKSHNDHKAEEYEGVEPERQRFLPVS